MADREQLEERYYKLAKRANRRLRNLEKLGESRPEVLNWSYRIAQHDIRSWRGEGENRFSLRPSKGESIRKIQSRLADVEKFLEMETSTLRGISKLERKRVKTLNKKFSSDLTVSDFENFTRSGMLDKLKNDYGSDQAFRAVAQIQRQMDTIEEQIRQHKKRSIVIDKDDPILQGTVDKILSSRKYGKKLIDVLQ